MTIKFRILMRDVNPLKIAALRILNEINQKEQKPFSHQLSKRATRREKNTRQNLWHEHLVASLNPIYGYFNQNTLTNCFGYLTLLNTFSGATTKKN